MQLSTKAENIFSQLKNPSTKLGDLRNIAKEIKKDHELAMELWATGHFMARQLAILIIDKKLINQEVVNGLDDDMQSHNYEEKLQLMDWLMANQLAKDKKSVEMMLGWENSHSALQRRTFWYHQARLRWVGQTPPPNTEELLEKIEKHILSEEPEVQWAMNFTAGQIGVFQEEFRDRCIAIGENQNYTKMKLLRKDVRQVICQSLFLFRLGR